MNSQAAVHVIVSGRVQGVGFRYFTVHRARSHGLVGIVRNLPTGQVEVLAVGSRSNLVALLRDLKRGPSGSDVQNVSTDWIEPTDDYACFDVVY